MPSIFARLELQRILEIGLSGRKVFELGMNEAAQQIRPDEFAPLVDTGGQGSLGEVRTWTL